MWLAATTSSMPAATAQIVTKARTATVIFRRLVKRRRPGVPFGSASSGRSALGSPGEPFSTERSVL
jgi:hypothetical protein